MQSCVECATEIRNVVSEEVLGGVLGAYGVVGTKVFLVAAVMAAVGLVPAGDGGRV